MTGFVTRALARRGRGLLHAWLVIPAALVLGAAPAGAAAEHSTRPVFDIPSLFSGSPEIVGSSTLVRTDSGMSATVGTTGLTPGDVVTLWWVVFNNPNACVAGLPGVSRCGPPDEGTAAAQPSILAATGRIVARSGTARYGASLRVGDTAGALFGPGLLDVHGAEVILVLRSHGPKIPALLSEMLHTFGAGCQEAPPGTGTPGPNDCAEVQVSVHTP